jgi:hypothetical protein
MAENLYAAPKSQNGKAAGLSEIALQQPALNAEDANYFERPKLAKGFGSHPDPQRHGALAVSAL